MTEFKLNGRMKDLTGNRSGRLVVLKPLRRNKHHRVVWLAECDCGAQVEVDSSDFGSGHTKSCGCLRTDTIVAFNHKDVTFKKVSGGCLISTSHKARTIKSTGYSVRQYKGRVRHEHIIQWLEKTGNTELPSGYELHHCCGNKACANVEHLQLLTCSEHSELHRAKPVVAVHHETGDTMYFKAIKYAREVGYTGSSITQCINGTKELYLGYFWMRISWETFIQNR